MKAHELIDRLAALDEATVAEPEIEPDVMPPQAPPAPSRPPPRRAPSHDPYTVPPDFEPGQMPRPKAEDDTGAIESWLDATQQPIQDWDWNGQELHLLLDDGSTEVYTRQQLDEIGVFSQMAFAEAVEASLFAEEPGDDGPAGPPTEGEDATGTLDAILGRDGTAMDAGGPEPEEVMQTDGEPADKLVQGISDIVAGILGIVQQVGVIPAEGIAVNGDEGEESHSDYEDFYSKNGEEKGGKESDKDDEKGEKKDKAKKKPKKSKDKDDDKDDDKDEKGRRQMNVWDIIIEAIDDPSGLIHPERHQAFSQRTHPLGNNPAYPEHQAAAGERASNYEEVLATKQWQKILEKAHKYLGVPLTTQALPVIQQKLVSAMRLIDQVESRYKEELEALAVELVFELPEFRSAKKSHDEGRFQIDAQITDDISLEGTADSESPEAQAPMNQERTPAEKQWMQKMIQRRHFTNAMIQGSAVSNNFAFEMGGAQLDRIHPGLRKAYGTLMISTELGYWMFPQSVVIAGARNQSQVGTTEVTFVENPNEVEDAEPDQEPPQGQQPRIPLVKARGMSLPVLIQEIIKGLTELVSLPSLPRDPVDRKEVLDKTDLIDLESWHMMLGPKLWDSFIEATDAQNERELTMHLYRHVQQMDVDEFNQFMKEVLAKSPRGIQLLRELATQIKAELGGEENVNESELIVRAILED